VTDTGVTVPVFWTCHDCGLAEQEIGVRERQPDEYVIAWMRSVQVAVRADHATSPKCKADRFDLRVPMSSRDSRVGEALRH
jgi:hypothetical protein